MVNRSRQKGTAYETEIVNYLRTRGWVHAERRALSGNNDRGDISGLIGVCIECKSAKAHDLPGWLNQLETETANSGADIGLLFIRRRGTTDRSRDYVVMTAHQATKLLADLEGWTASLIANLALAAGWTASAARSRSRRRELQEQRTMIPDDLKPEGRE